MPNRIDLGSPNTFHKELDQEVVVVVVWNV
jgi:hypothetical protein